MKWAWPATVLAAALVGAIAVVTACGSGTSSPQAPQQAIAAFPATRWVPSNPTYVVATRTVADAQKGLRDVVDTLGMLFGVNAGELSEEFRREIGIDPMSGEGLSAVGVDANGGLVMFSEQVSPTFVVRLAAADQMRGFFDQRRASGMVTQSVIVDGTEIFTVNLSRDARISWAIADDWLWLHFSSSFDHEDATSWFTRSYRPGAPAWTANWQWAERAAGSAAGSLIGVADLRRVVGALMAGERGGPSCAGILDAVDRVAIALGGNDKQISGRLTIDVGAAAPLLAAAALPAPEGWNALTSDAPLAAEWNVDLKLVVGWLAKCAELDDDIGEDPAEWFEETGVRSARGVIRSFDPDGKSGSGAVALDLAHSKTFAQMLDEIPMRSTLERKVTFGPYAGKSLSIPFSGLPTIEYVLTDKVALAGAGDGVLGTLIGKGGTAPGPLAAITIVPSRMSVDSWAALLELADLPRARRAAELIQGWREAKMALTIDGTSLVVSASGTRR
ncbi:MAG: hypothetical protein AB7O24_24560 [Kofleriaceae bacterium]